MARRGRIEKEVVLKLLLDSSEVKTKAAQARRILEENTNLDIKADTKAYEDSLNRIERKWREINRLIDAAEKSGRDLTEQEKRNVLRLKNESRGLVREETLGRQYVRRTAAGVQSVDPINVGPYGRATYQLAAQTRGMGTLMTNAAYSALAGQGVNFVAMDAQFKGLQRLRAEAQATLQAVSAGKLALNQQEVQNIQKTLVEALRLEESYQLKRLQLEKKANAEIERERKRSESAKVAGGRKAYQTRTLNELQASMSKYGIVGDPRTSWKNVAHDYRNIDDANRALRRFSALGRLTDDQLLARGLDPTDFRESHLLAQQMIRNRKTELQAYETWSPMRQWWARASGRFGDPNSRTFTQRLGAGLLSPFMGISGGAYSPYGRSFNTSFNRFNQYLTHGANLMGSSIYGLGAVGAGSALVIGSVKQAAEAEKLQAVLAGLLNTYAKFRTVSGEVVSAQDNIAASLARSKKLYLEIRQAAVESPLTTVELFSYYMAGAPFAMGRGVTDRQAITIVERMGTLGTAMGLAQRDVEQDIRATLMGDVRQTNKIGKILGFTGEGIKGAFAQGPGEFMKYFNERFKGIGEVLDKVFGESFVAKWSAFVDKMQQIGIKIGTNIIPAILQFTEKFSKTLDEWVSSGRLVRFAESVSNVLSGVGEAFIGFVNFMAPMTTSLSNILILGFGTIMARFVAQAIWQSNAFSNASRSWIGVMAMVVAGTAYWAEKMKKDILETDDSGEGTPWYNRVLGAGLPGELGAGAKKVGQWELRNQYADDIRSGQYRPVNPLGGQFLDIKKTLLEARKIEKEIGINSPQLLDKRIAEIQEEIRSEHGTSLGRGYSAPLTEGSQYARIRQLNKKQLPKMLALQALYNQLKNTSERLRDDPVFHLGIQKAGVVSQVIPGLQAEAMALRSKFSGGRYDSMTVAERRKVDRQVAEAIEGSPSFSGLTGVDAGAAKHPANYLQDLLIAQANTRLAGIHGEMSLLPPILHKGLLGEALQEDLSIARLTKNRSVAQAGLIENSLERARAIGIAEEEYKQTVIKLNTEYKSQLKAIGENVRALEDQNKILALGVAGSRISGNLSAAEFNLNRLSPIFALSAYSTTQSQVQDLTISQTRNEYAQRRKEIELKIAEFYRRGGSTEELRGYNLQLQQLGIEEANAISKINRGFTPGFFEQARYNFGIGQEAFAFGRGQARAGFGAVNVDDLRIRALQQQADKMQFEADSERKQAMDMAAWLMGTNTFRGMTLGGAMATQAETKYQDRLDTIAKLNNEIKTLTMSFAILNDSVKLSAAIIISKAQQDMDRRITNALEPGAFSFAGLYRTGIENQVSNIQNVVDRQLIGERFWSEALGKPQTERYWEMRRATLTKGMMDKITPSGSAYNRLMFNDLAAGGIAGFLTNIASGQAPGPGFLSAFSSFGEIGQNRFGGQAQSALSLLFGKISVEDALNNPYLRSYVKNGKIDRNMALRDAGIVFGGQLMGQYIGANLMGGNPASVAQGSSIGMGVATLLNANPWITAGAAIFGGVLGGLFGGKKRNPADEAHKRRLEELLSRIDRNLRPQADYFRSIRGEVLFGSASKFLSGRNNGTLSIQSGLGG